MSYAAVRENVTLPLITTVLTERSCTGGLAYINALAFAVPA